MKGFSFAAIATLFLALSLIVLADSFMPGSFIYPSAPVHALWRLSLKQNDKEMLLLVRSNFWKKYYNMVNGIADLTDTLRIF